MPFSIHGGITVGGPSGRTVVSPIVRPSRSTVHRERPLYGESQQGHYCRMHALNAYYGRRRFAPAEFQKLCDEFDKFIGFPAGTTRQIDIMERGYSLVSFVVERLNEFGERCVLSSRQEAALRPRFTPMSVAAHGITAAFMMNDGHVWAWRLHGGTWYEIDSQKGGGRPQPQRDLRKWNDERHHLIVCYPWHATEPPVSTFETIGHYSAEAQAVAADYDRRHRRK